MSEHFVTFDQVVKKTVRKTVRLELLHCPFCGGEAEFRSGGYSNGLGQAGVKCTDCKVSTPLKGGCGEDPRVRAADLWNRRAQT